MLKRTPPVMLQRGKGFPVWGLSRFCILPGLQRNVSMLFGRIFVTLGLEHLQGVNDSLAGIAWTDHAVNISSLRGDIRIGKAVTKFFDLLLAGRVHDLLFFRL